MIKNVAKDLTAGILGGLREFFLAVRRKNSTPEGLFAKARRFEVYAVDARLPRRKKRLSAKAALYRKQALELQKKRK